MEIAVFSEVDWFRSAIMKRNGFTLVELMIVVVIIGVLAALAIPRFTKASMKSKASEPRTVLKHIYEAALEYYQQYGSYPKASPWGGIWFFNNATTKNTNWRNPPGFKVNRPTGYPRFTYLFWSWKNHFRAYAWGWSPDSWDAQMRKVNDLSIDENGVIRGGTIMAH